MAGMTSFARALLALAVLCAVSVSPAAIPNDPKATTEHDYRRALLAFTRRTLVDVYKTSGKKNAKWDEPAIEFLDGMCLRIANADAFPRYRLPGEASVQELRDRGKA